MPSFDGYALEVERAVLGLDGVEHQVALELIPKQK